MDAVRFPVLLRVRVRSSPSNLTVRSALNGRRRRTGHPHSLSSEPPSPLSAEVTAAICFQPQPISRGRPRRMSCTRTGPTPTAAPVAGGGGGHAELNDESDFDALLSPDGYIYICGFGSLLSEKSARSTFPELRNFRVALLRGFRRVFAHTAPVFFERGIAKEETGEISSLSVEPCEGEALVVTVFEIRRSEIPSFIEREHEFRFLAVRSNYCSLFFSLVSLSYLELKLLLGVVMVCTGDTRGTEWLTLYSSSFNSQMMPCCCFLGSSNQVLCARYSDEEYFRVRCKGSREIYFQRYGRYNIQRIWRNDILPCRVYLRHCVLAAKNLGQEAYDNFLDHTYVADRVTTIRKYLLSTGSGIMEEEPPESLRNRYGG